MSALARLLACPSRPGAIRVGVVNGRPRVHLPAYLTYSERLRTLVGQVASEKRAGLPGWPGARQLAGEVKP